MEYYPPSLVRLIKHLSRLPGVGEKTATRLSLHILRSSQEEAKKLSQSILDVKEQVRLCSTCFGLADTDPCGLCRNPNRDRSLLCIVEQPSDLVALEKSAAFKGLYHVLHGVISPMEGIGPDNLKIKELLSRIAAGEVRELVLATNTSVEGEATASYLSQVLGKYPVTVTRIASGVPMGSDLKYLDEVTLRRALERRQGLQGV
jgi:recombination protein RecR